MEAPPELWSLDLSVCRVANSAIRSAHAQYNWAEQASKVSPELWDKFWIGKPVYKAALASFIDRSHFQYLVAYSMQIWRGKVWEMWSHAVAHGGQCLTEKFRSLFLYWQSEGWRRERQQGSINTIRHSCARDSLQPPTLCLCLPSVYPVLVSTDYTCLHWVLVHCHCFCHLLAVLQGSVSGLSWLLPSVQQPKCCEQLNS